MAFPIGISFLQVQPGEENHHYRDIANFDALLAERKMPDVAAIWGWGEYYKTGYDYADFFSRSFKHLPALLQEKSLQPGAIVVSGAPAQEQAGLETVIAAMFPELSTGQNQLVFVSESGCTSLVRAVEQASALLEQDCAHVLVLETARVGSDATHFEKFALVSDASLAMLLSRETGDCEWVISDVLSLANTDPDSQEDDIVVRSLDRECVEQLLSRNDLFEEDVDQLLYMNLFKPMTVEKAKGLGFDADSVYTDAIPLFGHCFGLDPFINMQQYFKQEDAGSTVLLCASSLGYAGALLVKR